MKSVFQASTGIEAHMINNLLHLNDIESEVFGEHLQGGIGDLQAIGVVRVMVADEDFDRARKVVADWESTQSASPSSEDQDQIRRGGFGSGLLGFILGASVILLFLQSSIEHGGIDYNGDGKLDEQWKYLNNQLRSAKIDQNRDGETDLIYQYDLNGLLSNMKADNDFDGRYEYSCRFKRGNTSSCRADLDDDGFYERQEHYTHGVLSTISIFDASSQKLRKEQFIKAGRLTVADFDVDGDGKLETRYKYDEFEQEGNY